MILSVIIVNYRVRHFLELCLRSVEKACANLGPAEIIVIDNHSGDGSIGELRPLFPTVRFIENEANLGFAKANNQGLALARGEFILFLNPDTVVPEDFGCICLDSFRGLNAGAGALGVRMIDGSGYFLPESRRGFPTPWVAFCKLSGLSALFPRSRAFGRYYLGHLPEDRTAPAPVLSGACMWTRRDILESVGGFDERFFMYAEDIDLSYRIEQAGYTNYYLAATTIIHFKGESTRKDIRYIRQFYKAMSQFRRKHFNRGLPAVFNAGMEAAIWIRVGIGRIAKRRGAAVVRRNDAACHIHLAGDAGEMARVEGLLGPGMFAGTGQEADSLLLCEGPAFSFRECITALEAAGDKYERILFHAAGTGAAVGSPERDGSGETLLF